MKYIEAYKIKPKKMKEQAVLRKTTPPGSFLLEVLDHIELNIEKATRKPEIFRHFQTQPNWWDCIDLYSLALDFMEYTQSTNAKDFMKFCSEKMTLSACEKANRFTESQADNKLWHKLRYSLFYYLNKIFNQKSNNFSITLVLLDLPLPYFIKSRSAKQLMDP